MFAHTCSHRHALLTSTCGLRLWVKFRWFTGFGSAVFSSSKLSQLSASLRSILLILQEIWKFKVNFCSSLVFQSAPLCTFQTFVQFVTLRTSLKFDSNFPLGDKRRFWVWGRYNFGPVFFSSMFTGYRSFLALHTRIPCLIHKGWIPSKEASKDSWRMLWPPVFWLDGSMIWRTSVLSTLPLQQLLKYPICDFIQRWTSSLQFMLWCYRLCHLIFPCFGTSC